MEQSMVVVLMLAGCQEGQSRDTIEPAALPEFEDSQGGLATGPGPCRESLVTCYSHGVWQEPLQGVC